MTQGVLAHRAQVHLEADVCRPCRIQRSCSSQERRGSSRSRERCLKQPAWCDGCIVDQPCGCLGEVSSADEAGETHGRCQVLERRVAQ